MKYFAFTLIFLILAGSAFAGEELRNINGVNLSVQEAGEGQAMILLHGKGYSKEYMNSLFDYYKGKYHVFSYDSRGHGKSDKPESFTLDDNADDLAGLIKSYGLDRPIIIGFSMGSYITLKAAEKYPDLFSKIVLIGTRGQGDTYPPERISEAKDANDAAIIGLLINFDLVTDIKNVKTPALVITGENDKTNPVDEGRKVAEALPDAKFYVIPNAEHVAFMKPEGFAQVCNLIDEFLTLELDYSDHEPLGNMRTTFLNDVFFPAIERETQGRVKIKTHWNAEISTGYNAIKAINQESADLAVVVPEYCMKNLHLHQLFKSFPVGPTGQEQVNFFRNVYHEIPELVNELEANNLHAVIIATGYPAAFFSAKPLSNLQAIKGQRWRSASFWHKDFLSNAGAEPVTMACGPGVSDALKEGTLDGLIVNIDSGYDINAHKPAPNILVSQKLWLGHEYIIAINKSIWDNLAQADKDAIERAAESSYSVLGEIMNTSFTRQIEILRADGAEVRIMNEDEVSFWENSTDYENVQDKWISDDVQAAEALKKLRELIGNSNKSSCSVKSRISFSQQWGLYIANVIEKDGAVSNVIIDRLANGKSSKELHDNYGIKPVSTLNRDWWEQVAYYESWVVEHGLDAVETDEKGHALNPDLISGATINVAELSEAVKNAFDGKTEAEGYSIKTGTSYSNIWGLYIANVIFKDGEIFKILLDRISLQGEDSKEKYDNYGIKRVSSINKDWWEQVAYYEEWVLKNGIDAVKYDKSGKAENVDLISGATIGIDDLTLAVLDALNK